MQYYFIISDIDFETKPAEQLQNKIRYILVMLNNLNLFFPSFRLVFEMTFKLFELQQFGDKWKALIISTFE